MSGAAPEARRLRAASRLRFAILVLLVLAPLPFGCVEDWSRFSLIVALGLAFAYFVWNGLPFILRCRERVAIGLAAAYLVWLAFQIVPLPPAGLAAVSPAAARLYRIGVPGYGETDARGYAYPDVARLARDPAAPVAWVTPSFSRLRSISLYPYGTYTILCQTAALLAFVAMGVSLFRERRDRRSLAYALVAAGAFEALYGIFESVTGHQHIFGYVKRYYTDEATGTLINRNHYAGLLNMILPLGIALALDERRGARALRGLPFRARLARLLTTGGERRPILLFACVVMGLAVVLSRSRMGITSMLAGVVLLSLLMAARERREGATGAVGGTTAKARRRWVWAALPAGLLLAVTLFSVATDLGPTIERFFDVRHDLEAISGRPALWRETLPVTRQFLWTGAGAGAYPFALNPNLKNLPGRNFWFYSHAHNDYLEAATTLGLIGVLLAGASLLVFFVRRPRSFLSIAAFTGIVTLLLHSVTDFLLAVPSNAFLACALLCLLSGRRTSEEITAADLRPATRRPIHVAAAAVCVLALILGPGRSLAAAAGFRPYWNVSPDRPLVAGALEMARALEPWNDAYPRRLGEALLASARHRPSAPLMLGEDLIEQVRRRRAELLATVVRAQRHVLECLERNPLDFEVHFDVAEIATTVRAVLRETAAQDGDMATMSPEAASLTAPHVASVSLAPTATGNQTALGWLLWRDRANLDEAGTAAALELLRRGLADPAAPRAWYDTILNNADNVQALVTIEEALHPPSGAYGRLLRRSSARTTPEFFACATAFQATAAVREASAAMQLFNDRTTPLDDDARSTLARTRDLLTGTDHALRGLSLAPLDAAACPTATSTAAITHLQNETDRILTTVDDLLLQGR